MKIGIGINGSMRNLLGKVKSVYEKYYDKKVEGELTYDNLVELLGFEGSSELGEFLYVEAPMEIFGHAKESEGNIVRELNTLQSDNRELEFTILSDDISRAIPATHWFLAKYGSQIKNIKFYSGDNVDNLWDYFDLIFTDDKSIFNCKPENKLLYTIGDCPSVSPEFKLDKPSDFINLEIFKKEHDEERA
tara:strand:- start:9697 stop:10266 length:570 start_codon:yes stop_codon:yes gene_type:complete